MKSSRVIAVFAACVIIAITLISSSRRLFAQGSQATQPSSNQVYNPYPPGILPSNLNAELMRVETEVDFVEARAMARWKALKLPTISNNPPVLEDTGTEAIETLGELMNFDRTISPKKNSACASCHMPYVAFSGPIPSVNLTMVAYPGTEHFRAAKRTAQRYTYAPFFPVLQYNATQSAFFGGNFWDSRATGYQIRNPDANQAQGPPVDTLEMGNPDLACIAYKLSKAPYRSLFDAVWGADALNINFPPDTAEICATPGGAAVFGSNIFPVQLSPADRTKAENVYDHWGQSLDAYEQSVQVSAFTSKFDAYLAGNYTFTPDEAAGYKLFDGKGNCNSCHLDGRSTAPTPPPPEGNAPNGVDTGATALVTPLFTCFGSANLGLPLNPRIALYYETKPDPYGFTPNPAGFGYRDLGLGSFLRSTNGNVAPGTWASPNASWRQYAPINDGRMQTLTARNVAMTPYACTAGTEAPGPYFQKEFFHNGYIKSLKQLVHFYNTRDVYKYDVTSGHCPAGTTEKVDCWPEPEVPATKDMSVGDLMLTDQEESQLVAFLETLTDGYTQRYPNRDAFAGECMRGGSAATQGNDYLIPTPPLPPCESAVCDVSPLPTSPAP